MNKTGKTMSRGFILIVCLMITSCQGNTESFRNLSRTKRQFSEHCLLPDHPANGELKILGEEQKTYTPNTSVILNTIIDLSCKSGYLTETGGLARAICYQGDWKPNISRIGRCRSICLLPDHPPNGELKILGEEQKTYSPNTRAILNTIIDLSCKSGYLTETGGLARAICYQGVWKPTISRIGGCVRRCPLVEAGTSALRVVCKRKSREINCGNSVEGTVLEVVCKPFYEIANAINILCVDGTWDSIVPSCEPVCGKKGVGVQPSITGGATAIKAEYPWVAGVYNSSDEEFLGGATIISPSVLLSAAHIFTDDEGHPKDKNDYVIAGGKYYRIFNDTRDDNMQTSRIERIYIPVNYRTGFQNYYYSKDFAIIKLEHSFALTEYVQPVCIDLGIVEKSDLRNAKEGIIAGYTQGGYHALAEELKVLPVSIESRQSCLLPLDFEKFYTYDKLCAGAKDASVCGGDSGGGLFLRNSDSRFYIKGILSAAPRSQTGCDTNSSALYTQISWYLKDIAAETGRPIIYD